MLKKTHSKILIAATGPLFFAACQTTSDVVAIGPDTYRVNAAACPACGGTSQSLQLATEKAAAFCEEKGQALLELESSSRNLNAVGAGATNVEFRCVDPVSESDVQVCYNDMWIGIGEEFGLEAGAEIFEKANNYKAFAQLSDNTYPNPQQKLMLSKLGGEVEQCIRLEMSVMHPLAIELYQILFAAQMTALAQLSNGELTFSEYAQKMNDSEADYTAAVSERRIADAEAARWQAEQTMRAMENYNYEMGRLIENIGSN